jgi:hypothetical protein
MTITRIWQAGAELNNILSEFDSVSGPNIDTSSAVANSGTYSFRVNSLTRFADKVLSSALSQARIGFFVYHNGPTSGNNPALISLYSTSTICINVRFDGTTLSVRAGSTVLGSVLSAAFAATGVWKHVGLDVKIASSGGWVYLYLDGVLIFSFDGDTNDGAATFNKITIGSPIVGHTWAIPIYYDDIYLDNLSGESAPTAPPDYRFLPVLPNGNGISSQWLGNDGNRTDNYLLVDDIPPDNDTTYVESSVSGEKDSYDMTDPTIPTGWEVSAVIPFAVVKKLNAGGALNLKLETRTTISGSPSFASSAAIVLGTAYALAWERRVLNPSGGGWTTAMINALAIGVITD